MVRSSAAGVPLTSDQFLEGRIKQLEEEMDTFVKTHPLKRLWFCFLGWPLRRIVDHPQRRPWPISVIQRRQWRKANG